MFGLSKRKSNITEASKPVRYFIGRKHMPVSYLMLAVAMMAFSQFGYSSSAAPEPGATCSEPGAVYNYSTDVTKTPWILKELYAVPAGTADPATWDSSSDFKTQFTNELGTGLTPQDYALACGAVWQNFFSDNASVLFNAHRTVTATEITLQCTSGTWAAVSTETRRFDDVSDWLTAGSGPYQVGNPASVTQLQQDLESTLTNLNAQPGAAN